MNQILKCAMLAASLSLVVPVVANAQPQQRAYAPDNLQGLSAADQVRVISREYSEQSSGRRIPDDQLRFYLDQVDRSDWTFSRIRQDMAESLSSNGNRYGHRYGDDDNGRGNDDDNDNRSGNGNGYGNAGQRPPVAGGSIRCESREGRQKECATPWQSRSRLVRQLTSTPCVEGRSWGSQRGTVWVSGGCRAEFAAGGQTRPPAGGDALVTCESKDGRFKACAWNAADGKPRIARQISSQPCESGRSWGYDGRRLWVNHGCRAEFSGRRGAQAGNGYSVTCSSTDSRATTCAWNANYGRPVLLEQISSTPCVEGRTWSYRGGTSLQVSGGCRARFGAR